MVDFLDVTWSESTQYNKSQMSHPVLSNKLRQKLSFTISQTWKPCANLIISIENIENWNHNPHNPNMHIYIYIYVYIYYVCVHVDLLIYLSKKIHGLVHLFNRSMTWHISSQKWDGCSASSFFFRWSLSKPTGFCRAGWLWFHTSNYHLYDLHMFF